MSNHLDQLINTAIEQNSVATAESETTISTNRKLQEANAKLVEAINAIKTENYSISVLSLEMCVITKRILEKLTLEYNNGQVSLTRLAELEASIKQTP